MQNYTVETFLSHDPGISVRAWVTSFLAANLLLAVLLLVLAPLLKTIPQTARAPETEIEWLPEPPAAPTAVATPPTPEPPQPPQPPEAPPPKETTPTAPPPLPATPPETPPEPPQEKPEPPKNEPEKPPAPPKTIQADAQPLAFNHQETPDQTPPDHAPFAGLSNTPAQSRQPDPSRHDPVPVQPDGVSGQVLATGTVGDNLTAPEGITLQETQNPGDATAQPTPATQANSGAPNAAQAPAKPVATVATTAGATAATTAAGAAIGAPAPPPPSATPAPPPPPLPTALPAPTPTTPSAPAAEPLGQAGMGPDELPAKPSAPTPPTAEPLPIPTPAPDIAKPPVPVGAGGQVDQGHGESTTSTAREGQDNGSLAAELARLESLKPAATTAPTAGETGRPSTVQIEQPASRGDTAAVSKTPLWSLHLNAEKQGPDTIETYADPVAKYLKDFRRILEQNFYREAGLPRSYRFRDGEYADFAMTFHADGKIDAVALVPGSATEQFTEEMITICKTAIARSGPYNPFTDELKKERTEFTLIVRFQF